MVASDARITGAEVLVPQCLPCLERPRGRVAPKSCVVPGGLGWVGDQLLTRGVEAAAPPTASPPEPWLAWLDAGPAHRRPPWAAGWAGLSASSAVWTYLWSY